MARATKADVIVRILGDAAGFTSATKKAQWEAMALSRKLEVIGAKMKDVGRSMTMGVTLPVVAGFALATKAALQDAKSQEVLAKQVRNATRATDEQIAGVEDFIDTQARLTGVMDDELRPAYGRLVSATGDLTRSQELLRIAQDTAAGTGRSLDSVITAMIKGANGSTAGFSRMGIATRDAAGNALTFDQILGRLDKRFKGLAATKATPMEKMRVALSEAGETIGRVLLPYVQKAAEWITRLAEKFEGMSPTTKKVIVVTAALAAGMGPLLIVIGQLATAIPALVAAYNFLFAAKVRDGIVTRAGIVQMTVLRAKLLAHAVASKVAAAAQWVWNAALSANPIGLVIAAVAALAVAVVVLYKKNETFRNVVKKAWAAVKVAVAAVTDAVAWVWAKMKALWSWVSANWSSISKWLKVAFWPVTLAIAAARMWIEVAGRVYGWVRDHWSGIKDWLRRAFQPIQWAIDAITRLIDKLGQAWDYIKGLSGGGGVGRGKGGVGRTRGGFASGGIAVGPESGYTATLHGTELIVPLDRRFAPAAHGGTVVNVYLDSEPIAARVEVRQAQRARRRARTLGVAPA